MDFSDVEPPDLRAFLEHLAFKRRASKLTIGAYQHDLIELVTMLAEAGQTLQSATQLNVRNAVIELRKRDLSASTTARYLSSWRSFYRYAITLRGYTRNPTQGLRAPKHRRPLPKMLSPDYCKALLDNKPAETSPLSPVLLARDQAMFELLYSSGLRVSELANLCIPDLDLKEGEARVTGKGNKTRIVPVGKTACAAVASWYEVRALVADEEEKAVFVSRRGTKLTTRNIQKRLESWSHQSPIGQHVHPHMLRHAFASHLLQSSQNLRAVQEMLGHENIATTQIYTHLDWQHLAASYDKAHPRARRVDGKKPDESKSDDANGDD